MEPRQSDTGDTQKPTHTKQCPFGRYLITVRLGLGDEFLCIEEVAVSKDFLTTKQKTASRGVHDVSDLYPE